MSLHSFNRRGATLIAVALMLTLPIVLSPITSQAVSLVLADFTPTVYVYLPVIEKEGSPPPPTASPTPTRPPSIMPGRWIGATSRGQPLLLDVSSDSAQWSNFVLTTDFAAPSCGVSYSELTQTTAGPGNITSNQFSFSGGVFSFTGRFNSATTASGTYTFSNYPFVYPLPGPPYVCVFYLTQSGTWTANWQSTPAPTHTPTPSATSATTATPTQTPTATPTIPPASTPVPGHWAGTTSRGRSMSFDVSLNSTQWMSFTLSTDFSAPSCGVGSSDLTVTRPGPGSITNNQFSSSGGGYAFTGQFNSATAASGTYAFDNFQIVIGLPYPPYVCFYYLTQSGAWTAGGP
ncbi:MAG TPA: hypothetical protein VJG32_22340 [Anaerolineae bacterium]|nr:hypothetical protein [Anaerolineae bacterium]